MTLKEGITLYIANKRAMGMSFTKGDKTYQAFLKTVGNLSLSQISIYHVSKFLNHLEGSAWAFRRRHSLLRRFLEYWTSRGEISGIQMPANRPAQLSRFLPHIYTQEELRKLMRLALLTKTANDKIHCKTVGATLLMLYATGATVHEVTSVGKQDVDLFHGSIRFSGNQLKSGRCVPIGRDLIQVMGLYIAWQKRIGSESDLFFSRIDGRIITPRALAAYFNRLRRRAGIAGSRESNQRPCLRDFRATFAVHQITSWIKKKKELNQMLPALGAYMGNLGLESTERYLRLTPERFQGALDKLSPQKIHTRWRNDSQLLEFLTSL